MPTGKGQGKGPRLPAGVQKPLTKPVEELKLKLRTASELNAVPYTVVTQANGKRTMHKSDGTIMPLADVKDEMLQWASTPKLQVSDTDTAASLANLHPGLADYHKQFASGVPLKVLKVRVAGEFGAEMADRFLACLKPGEGMIPEKERSCAEMHGRLGDKTWAAPVLAAECHEMARPGYNSQAAHEYLDDDAVLQQKASALAKLIRKAKCFVIYAGAGLSTSAGIGDYATQAGVHSVLARTGTTQSMPASPFSAKPSVSHHAIAAMAAAGLLHRLVQQNHDGLPQKAGVPQALVNEIHGGWFDPSNPVVSMSGNLRKDLFDDVLGLETKADLVLVLGSSLCGMNADRLVGSCSKRALRSVPSDPTLGSVIVSLQRTPHDANSSIRIFAPIDRVMELVVAELNVARPPPQVIDPAYCPQPDVFSVPYDEKGLPVLPADSGRRLLDLRDGSSLVMAVGPNKGAKACVEGKNADGHYRISVWHANGVVGTRLLGSWWPAEAVAGRVAQLPFSLEA